MEVKNVKVSISEEKFTSLLNKMLCENIDVTISVTGNSMFPLWRHKRDSVVLTNCDKTALRKGDIPLYRRATGQYVMHRIIEVNTESCNLCGDAQTQIEYNMPKENIVAVVKGFTRKGRRYNCSNSGVRAYSTAWIWLLPLRRILLKVYSTLKMEKCWRLS
jgi:signal peptidase I